MKSTLIGILRLAFAMLLLGVGARAFAEVINYVPKTACEWRLLEIPGETAVEMEVNVTGKLKSMLVDPSAGNLDMTLKSPLVVEFKEPTRFFGQDYPAGKAAVDISHFMGWNSQTDYLGGLPEFHVTSDALSAADALWSARMLSDQMQSAANLHQHLIAKLPLEDLKVAPVATALPMVEHYRRVNLLLEALAVLRRGGFSTNTYTNKAEGYSFDVFDSLQPYFLNGIFRFLVSQPANEEVVRDSAMAFKLAFAGWRGPGLFRQSDLYSYEIRDIPKKFEKDIYLPLVTSVHNQMMSRNYGFDPALMQDWVRTKGVDLNNKYAVADALAETAYRWNYSAIKRRGLPVYLTDSLLRSMGSRMLLRQLMYSPPQNQAIKMLFYDWTKDPLFYRDSLAQQRMIDAQRKAVSSYLLSSKIENILREFLWQSGLLDKLAESFGLDVRAFQNINPI